MQKITQLMRDAFIDGTPFRRDNTEVRVTDYAVSIYLFGNKIAYKNEDGTFISSCGWPTNTTKDRLNALPNVSINQLKGMWYLNGNKWDGSSTRV